MNTPPTSKRHGPKTSFEVKPDGAYIQALTHPDYALQLAMIVTAFVHLEGMMSIFMAALLQAPTNVGGAYILRSIISPRGRIQVMRTLLERSPDAAHLGPAFDEVLREFSWLNSRRNDFVHGHWYTNSKDQSVWLAKKDEDGLAFFESAPVHLDELNEVVERIHQLTTRLLMGEPAEEYRRLMLASGRVQQSPAPKKPSRRQGRKDTQAPPPPPQSSEG